MAVATKIRSAKLAPYERALRGKLSDLEAQLREQRREVQAERMPDDTYGQASRVLMEDLAVGAIERNREMLREVRAALARLEEGEFGVCEGCGEPIPERRLKALPWARFCLACAERRQMHWTN